MGSKIEFAMNPWEVHALDYQFPDEDTAPIEPQTNIVSSSRWQPMQDSVIYPGLYSASGYDVMAILLRLMGRPNPQIELGPIDCSVALVLCDLGLPDEPIVYASDAFCELTGYAKSEIMGRNCRFLQTPASSGSKGKSASRPKSRSKTASSQMRHAIQERREIQLKVTNYRRNGQRFSNLVSIIPLDLDDTGYRYAVGFAVEV
ncbi:uncharacterized protein UV8b_00501 [Ustilaginoidea virens]|uniref:PAS domain-containing protein n=1 Tax=Ustilaginoidea virens TaxID=1159556 RepID=A0A1B5KVG6_USTVR|nr:uncharacterized protein UV8b_00501 [Ustilaginoidea virens]QUC16260.1 hypothetical protein UV8b_00501 [Ustilaginoidea virens]GAO14988.1 hypothetical protein UVI_02027840 [Ustilaginoidea virens]